MTISPVINLPIVESLQNILHILKVLWSQWGHGLLGKIHILAQQPVDLEPRKSRENVLEVRCAAEKVKSQFLAQQFVKKVKICPYFPNHWLV